MWAHYGDNHKGICLIFDKEELSAQFRKSDFIKIYEDKVDYLSFLPLIGNSILLSKIELEKFESESYNLELLYEFLDDNYLLKFKYFRKHIDWKTENEYRWLVFAKTTRDLNINFGSSLKAIVLGIDTDIKYKVLLEKYNIPIFKLVFNYGKYTYYEIK